MDHDLTQFLTGHGNIINTSIGLNWIAHLIDPIPSMCYIRKGKRTLKETVTPGSLIEKMLACLESWDAVNHMVERTQYRLREAEKAKKARKRMQSVGEGRG